MVSPLSQIVGSREFHSIVIKDPVYDFGTQFQRLIEILHYLICLDFVRRKLNN